MLSYASGNQPRGQLEQLQQLVAPAPAGDVEEQRPRRVGRVDRALACEPEAHVVLREQHVRDPAEDLRLVVPEPEQLRRRETGESAIPGQLDQSLEADEPLDLGALRGGALVVPEDRRPQHRVVRAERDEPVHLPGEAERLALSPADVAQRSLARTPPVVGILLGPAGLRRRERIPVLGLREHVPRRREGESLDAGRPDVQPDEPHAPRAA